MPAPKMLSGLPKPVLFGLYGAVGGLLGALAFGELVWFVLRPPPPKAVEAPPPPEPRLAITASKDLQIYQGGLNTLFVQIARDAFDDAVTVRVEGLPPGVTAADVTIPKGKTEAEIELRAAFSAASGAPADLKVVASAKPGGKAVGAAAPLKLVTLASPMPQADIVFVLDITGSMQAQINGLKDGIGTFASDLYKAKVDARFACLAFRDLTYDEPSQLLKFKGEVFTSDAAAFRDEVAKLRANGGGDEPESSFEAISEAAGLKDYRKSAVRSLVLITDARPKIVVKQGQSKKETIDSLRNNEIDFLHLVIGRTNMGEDPELTREINLQMQTIYREVQQGAIGSVSDKGVADKGKEFELDKVAKDSSAFTTKLLPEMTKAIVAAAESKRPDAKPELAARPAVVELPKQTVKSLQSSEQSEAGSEGKVVLRSAVWTGSITALVCLMLLGGQHHYLRGSLPSVGGVMAGLGGGLVVGFVGGAAGQGLFLLADTDKKVIDVLFRVMGWTILGSLAGAGLSLFVPNLKLVFGLVGGAIGGAVGALGYFAAGYIASKLFGEDAGSVIGRIAGGLVLGLFIGLMVAVVEAAFRRAWLEVRYGPREVVTVNLGAEPVKVGGDSRACTVWARGAPEVALRYFIRDGQVICTDVPARSESAVADGDTRAAGNVTVVVRTGSGTAPAARPARPPAPRAKPAPAPRALDLDDDDGLPMPISDPLPPPVRPAPAAAPPPRPAAPPRPVSPPAVKPTAKDPDACPSCGRKNAGRPGTRYCMVCDNTY